ncbi:matrixin family metalloprotease [Paludisphaera mucosa]|uniref:Matrixin family metalloprotease n=1 Tax=Paludisphaera mucosa TaxID=3030827 RepID=A0ABT6FDJ3_9BACT|nr:matrixin family metalloprotease [Paludisphaera mucosa]MDG3005624.1 matrixin family metalloprotease [Paludisphaera mucosa]
MEERLLLYATLGANWVYGSRITYSFVPDGTSIGGTPSTLYQTLNALYPTSVWQREFNEAAAVWQAVANVNLVQVSDDGSALGAAGYQQGDPRFGDIRFSAIPLAFGTLGAAYSPPQLNGGPLAGDVVLNSIMSWKIDANYDLKTVAIHEIGHALGMSHSEISRADMYSYYTAMKQALHSDDVSGIRSIYGGRQGDAWNSNGQSNLSYWDAKSLDGWRTSANQITVADLNITNPGQTEWFWVTIPSSNIGSFTVSAQSTNLSLLTPQVTVYDASLGLKGNAYSSQFGDTATLTIPGVSTGQGFFIRATASGGGSTGAYALQVNFGTVPLTPVAPPFTMVPTQNSQGAGLNTLVQGTVNTVRATERALQDHHVQLKIGNLSAWGDALLAPGFARASPALESLYAAAAAKAQAASAPIAATAEASAFGAALSFRHEVSPSWTGGLQTTTGAIDDVLAGWGGFEKSSVGKRRPHRS